jgi:hypothetical protein
MSLQSFMQSTHPLGRARDAQVLRDALALRRLV